MSQFIGLVHNLIVSRMEKGELNIDSLDALRHVLNEYEMHTKVIEEQLEICKKDHADLREEMNRLLNENRELYERLKTASETSMNRADHPAIDNSEVVENLQQQLALALDEKDAMEELWKASVKEVDSLKEKLEESGRPLLEVQKKLSDVQKDYTEAIKILEDKQSSLKSENDKLCAKCQVLEDQLEQAKSQISGLSEKNFELNNSLKESSEQEQQWKSKYLELEAKFIELDKAHQADKVKYAQIQELEKREDMLKGKLEEALQCRDELQCALERCQERMQDQLKIAAADRSKVEEAVSLVEGACRERDIALARELAAIEETKKMKVELEKLVDEAGKRVAQEQASLRRSFDRELAAVQNQLDLVTQDRNRKSAEVEQLEKECERLQHEAKQNRQSEDQAEKMAKELRAVESQCQRLQDENEELKNAVNKLEDKCKRNTQQRQKLKNDISRLVKDTRVYQDELARSEKKADILSNKLQASSVDLAKLHNTPVLSRGSKLSTVEPDPSLTSTLEMYKRLNESYGHMNEKWKTEMSAITDKFEEKLKRAKKQVTFDKDSYKAKRGSLGAR